MNLEKNEKNIKQKDGKPEIKKGEPAKSLDLEGEYSRISGDAEKAFDGSISGFSRGADLLEQRIINNSDYIAAHLVGVPLRLRPLIRDPLNLIRLKPA